MQEDEPTRRSLRGAPCRAASLPNSPRAMQEDFFDFLDAPEARVGQPSAPIPHSPPLIEALIPQVTDIEQAVRRVTTT